MTPFWVTFNGRKPACVEAGSENEARAKAEDATGYAPLTCTVLPYPAEPRVGEKSSCPSFCYSPETCKGRTACPKNYACSE